MVLLSSLPSFFSLLIVLETLASHRNVGIISTSIVSIYYARGDENINPAIAHNFLIKKCWLDGQDVL
jgi:hypothetical protein